MCYNNKCLHCVPVEHGTLTLGIISAICTGLTLLWSIIHGTIIALDLASSHDHTSGSRDGIIIFFSAAMEGAILLALVIFIVLVAVGSLIAFILSVLLCVGVRKRQPGKVLAYFIYGMIVVALSASASVIYLAEVDLDSNDSPLPGILGLLACCIYSPLLVMVYKTYVKLQQEAMFQNHIPLVENTKTNIYV